MHVQGIAKFDVFQRGVHVDFKQLNVCLSVWQASPISTSSLLKHCQGGFNPLLLHNRMKNKPGMSKDCFSSCSGRV